MCVSFVVVYGHGVRWITIEFTLFRGLSNPDDHPEVMAYPPKWADPGHVLPKLPSECFL